MYLWPVTLAYQLLFTTTGMHIQNSVETVLKHMNVPPLSPTPHRDWFLACRKKERLWFEGSFFAFFFFLRFSFYVAEVGKSVMKGDCWKRR